MMLIHASEKKDGEGGGEGENEETDIDGELSKIERNEDRENELEKMSELEKMPLALEPPNVLVDLPSASSARRSGNFFNFFSSSPDKNEDNENNNSFGTFLSFAFVVIVFVVFAAPLLQFLPASSSKRNGREWPVVSSNRSRPRNAINFSRTSRMRWRSTKGKSCARTRRIFLPRRTHRTSTRT